MCGKTLLKLISIDKGVCCRAIIFVLFFLFIKTALAELVPRAGGLLIYDTVRDVTWLADANYAGTIGYNPDDFLAPGFMKKTSAQAWVVNLDYAGFTDWRLPSTQQPDLSCSVQATNNLSHSYGCIGSELGHMFYTLLGGAALSTISSQHNSNYDLFININDTYGYYWATPDVPETGRSWAFRFDMGYQNRENSSMFASVWPVRDGDPTIDQPPDGDANFDGVIDAIDLQMVTRIVLGLYTPTAKEFLHLDVAPQQMGVPQPDGLIDSADLFMIFRMTLES